MIQKVIQKMWFAKKPLIIGGSGIRIANAVELFHKFLDVVNVEVALSFNGKDLLPTSHLMNLGNFGTLGCAKANKAIQNADVILVLGARMKILQTTFDYENFAPKAYKIHIDIDEKELSKYNWKPQLPINKDVKSFMQSFIAEWLTFENYCCGAI